MSVSKRMFDIIVHGATGFTGKEVVRCLQNNEMFKGISWAMSGRSAERMEKLKSELSLEDSIPCLIANSDDEASLVAAFAQGRLVLNCTGPYRFLGRPVVSACIQAGAHYMDICGEPQFMEDTFLRFHDAAQTKGVLVIHACAFDSVPADLGFLFAMRQFGGPDKCYSVESFLKIRFNPEVGFGGHFTTFECAVHGISDVDSLRRIRKESAAKYHPPALVPPKSPADGTSVPTLVKYTVPTFDQRVGEYVVPFMGADASVVRSTARSVAMQQRAAAVAGTDNDKDAAPFVWPQYAAYACAGEHWSSMLTMGIYGTVFSLLAGSGEYGRSWLLAYPELFSGGIFSRKGPTPEQLRETGFAMTFESRGWKQGEEARGLQVVRTEVSGPEPGYVATPVILLTLAQCLLREYGMHGSTLPKGGVFTPGAVFGESESILPQLCAAGIEFKVL